MPDLKIEDNFGFTDDVQLSGKNSLNKYAKRLPDSITLLQMELKSKGATSLRDIKSMEVGLDLGITMQLGDPNAVDLEIKPTVSGSIAVRSGAGPNAASLFDPDQFADNVRIDLNQCYVSACLNATVETDVSDKTSDLKFGFKASSGVKLSYYQPFDIGLHPPTLLEAIKETIANFTIPADLDDVAAMRPNTIAAVDGVGDLKFWGALNLAALTNAPVSLPLATVGPVQITAGGSFSVGASFELSGEYQVRVTRFDGQRFHLGLYRKRGTEFTLIANAKGGLTAGLGQDDLFGEILGVISGNPKADKTALAGLPAARVAEIQKVVKLAVDRTLTFGVTAELGIGSESEAMFLYEVDLDTITEAGRPLIHAALEGDLGPIVSQDAGLPPGIKVLKTLISKTKTLKHTLKVNLLGIYNFARVSELALKGAAAWNADTGELILTDTATASLIGIDALNFAADSKKLRHVLAEQFLISAAYKASGGIQGPPGMHAMHSYFEHALNLHRDHMRIGLMLGAAFQLISEQDALAKLQAGIKDFGKATVLAEAAYDDPAVEALFLDNNQPRDPSEYERAGRDAISHLVKQGDEDAYRLIAVTDDTFWNGLKQIGDAGSARFANLVRSRTQVPVAPDGIGVDYLNIVWWAETMHSCAQALMSVRTFINQNPNIDRGNHDFLAVKRALANHLRDVAAKTREDFGGPWGLIATFLLAKRVATANPTLTITNRYVSVSL